MASEEICLQNGGRYVAAGILGNQICFTPAPDAGQACTRAPDCAGVCLADSGTCSVELPTLGCMAILDDSGAKVLRCIE